MKNFTINELRENRAKSWEAAKAFLDSHRTDKGSLSAEDSETYDRMEAEIIALGKEIERMERSAALEAELSRPVGSPLTNIPGSAIDTKTGRASDAYKHSFLTALRSNFRQVSNVLTEGTDTSGGYLVPDEYDARLIEKLDEENVMIMRSLGTVIQTSGERKINVAASKPAASWIEECGELVFSDPQFSQIILDAYKLSVAVKVSEELLADNAYDLEGWLINSFSRALANSEEEAMVIGDGISKTTGILTSGEVGITTAGNKIEADEILTPIMIQLEMMKDTMYRTEIASLKERADDIQQRRYMLSKLCTEGCIDREDFMSAENEMNSELDEITSRIEKTSIYTDDTAERIEMIYRAVNTTVPERLVNMILEYAEINGRNIIFHLIGGLYFREVL